MANPGCEHPDFGSNAEINGGSEIVKLENLGPFEAIPPGGTVSWEEDWEVSPGKP